MEATPPMGAQLLLTAPDRQPSGLSTPSPAAVAVAVVVCRGGERLLLYMCKAEHRGHLLVQAGSLLPALTAIMLTHLGS